MSGKRRKPKSFWKAMEDALTGQTPHQKKGRKLIKKAGVSEIFGFKL